MKNILIILLLTTLWSCSEEQIRADAYGNFEAKEVLVSSEANGKLLTFSVEEGQLLKAGESVGQVDSTQLFLKKLQLYAAISAVRAKTQSLSEQEQVYEEQKRNLARERARLEKLLKDGAATPKQLDDLDGQLALVDRKKAAHLRSILTANRGISSEIAPIKAQIDQIDDQIRRTKVLNPMTGRVMAKFAEQSEMVSPMRPLYKIAKTDEVILRVYVSGSQLPHIALGQTVSVEIDENSTDNRELSGKITWIAEEAEFTPKTIQTKEDRVNLVYAVKIIVPNPEGKLKTGMPAEVNWGG